MFELTVRELRAWSPKLGGAQGGAEFGYRSDETLPLNHLAAGAARRLSGLSKTSVELGLEVTQKHQTHHVVFSSRHGELVHAHELLRMIGRREMLSPMMFSQSVHNSAIGAYTLAKQTRVPTTSLGAADHSFVAGLVSAYVYLREHPDHQVLYISADHTVPETFRPSLPEDSAPYVVAAVLGLGGSGQRLSVDSLPSPAATPSARPEPQALEFLRWFFSDAPATTLNARTTAWRLVRC